VDKENKLMAGEFPIYKSTN